MSKRHTWTSYSYRATCRGCKWTLTRCNALALAAQHHDKYGHSVDVEVTGSVMYLTDAEHQDQLDTHERLGLPS